jgi:hypothetical protein
LRVGKRLVPAAFVGQFVEVRAAETHHTERRAIFETGQFEVRCLTAPAQSSGAASVSPERYT